MRSVSYKGDVAALRTGCVGDADGQGTTQARARRCARWQAVAAGSAWRARDRAGDRLLAGVERREAELAVGISGDFSRRTRKAIRASTIRSNQHTIRIKVVCLCLVGGERRGETRRVGSHARASSSTCS
jgi:hypothetical protein